MPLRNLCEGLDELQFARREIAYSGRKIQNVAINNKSPNML